MLLQKFDTILNEYCHSPMDKGISKKQRFYIRHLQQRTSGKFNSTIKKQTLKKEPPPWPLTNKPKKTKKKVKRVSRISSLLKRRLLRECIARKVNVVLNKIEDCPDVNAVWIYDRSIGKYRWATYNDVPSHEDSCEKETQSFSESISEELGFVITEIRGNASDVFESVCFTSDAETEATLDYEGNAESDTDLGGIVEVHESYNPVFDGQNITVQINERETIEGPLNYEIKPNNKINSEDVCEEETSECEDSCVDSLEDSLQNSKTACKEEIVNGQNSPLIRKGSGRARKKRKNKRIKKSVKIKKDTSPLYFRKRGVKQKTEWRNFSFAKAKPISRITKHSKRFRDILKSAPRYWCSRSNFCVKKLINKNCLEDEKKPAVPLKQHLLETYQNIPDTSNKSKEFCIVDTKSENVTLLKEVEVPKTAIKLCIRRKASKAPKCPIEDISSNQANITDGSTARRKSDKQETNTTKNTTSEESYSLLDRELPGYNWLEKKIKSGEIKAPRRTSTASQENNLTSQETQEAVENLKDINNCDSTKETKEITTVEPQQPENENIPQEEIIKSPQNNDKPQREIPPANLQEDNLYHSESKEPLEVTSPESGVEIDVAPLSSGDSEGDMLAQGIYLFINEGDINSGNNSYVANPARSLIEKKDSTIEEAECNDKIQTVPTEETSNEMESRPEHDHVCNNEACLLSVPERLRIAKISKSMPTLEVPQAPVSWFKKGITGDKRPDGQKSENALTSGYSAISSPALGNSLDTNQEAGITLKGAEVEPNVIKFKDTPSTNVAVQDSNSPYSKTNESSSVESQKENTKKQAEVARHNLPPYSVKDTIVTEPRVTKTNHIPVQPLPTNPFSTLVEKKDSTKEKTSAIPRKINANIPITSKLYGKPEDTNEISNASIANTHLSPSISTKPQSQINSPMNNVNVIYAQKPQGCRADYLKRSYEPYLPPTTWPSVYPYQATYDPNLKSVMEPICQITEQVPPNSSLQNEKNFTISSLLELQTSSAQSQTTFEAQTKAEATKSTDIPPTTVIQRSQPCINPTTSNSTPKHSTLRSHLEGNIQRPKLPEPPEPDQDDDSTDDIKIIYNNVTSYQKPVPLSASNQSQASSKESVNCLSSASQTQSPHISYQDHPSATRERPEQTIAPTSSIPLSILPKPMPIQGPVRPSPVLVAPVVEKVDQQKIYQLPVADSLQPSKRTPPQGENNSPGYQNISSYHAPPKSLREEVEYRKRELMYLDQLARKREKEFERLQNIRKSKIRLLKLLEDRIPIALNKDGSAQKPVTYYCCAQTEKPMVSESWTSRASTQLVPSEKCATTVMPPPPQATGTTQITNVCNNYPHYPPPNDRIRYELNNFISSFNTQMQERIKDKDPATTPRKEHNAPLNREQPQNVPIVPPSSVPGFVLSQKTTLPPANVARIVPATHTKNRVIEASHTTMLPPRNYGEKGPNCQTNFAIPIPPPPPYSITTETNRYQTLPTQQKNYTTCNQYQSSAVYDPAYPGAPQKMVAPPLRLYDQTAASSQSSVPNQQREQQKQKEDSRVENAQQHYYGNKVWPDQPNWPKPCIQKIAPSNAPPYQPESRMPTSFWPVNNAPAMFNGSQRLKFQSDVVQQRIEDSSIGLVFVDASKTSHVCNYCNGNAIFLCSSCKKAWYCGRECQRRSWAQHSSVCVAD